MMRRVVYMPPSMPPYVARVPWWVVYILLCSPVPW